MRACVSLRFVPLPASPVLQTHFTFIIECGPFCVSHSAVLRAYAHKKCPPGNLVFGSRLVSQEEWYGPVPMASIPHLRIVRIVRMRASKKKRTALVYLHKTNEKQFASPKLSFQTTWEKKKSRTRDKPEYPPVGYSTEEERTGRKMMRWSRITLLESTDRHKGLVAHVRRTVMLRCFRHTKHITCSLRLRSSGAGASRRGLIIALHSNFSRQNLYRFQRSTYLWDLYLFIILRLPGEIAVTSRA